MSDIDTIAELFRRDPLHYREQDTDRIIEEYRDARRNYKISGKPVTPKTKAKVDPSDLGFL
jgi:hypothetical protein